MKLHFLPYCKRFEIYFWNCSITYALPLVLWFYDHLFVFVSLISSIWNLDDFKLFIGRRVGCLYLTTGWFLFFLKVYIFPMVPNKTTSQPKVVEIKIHIALQLHSCCKLSNLAWSRCGNGMTTFDAFICVSKIILKEPIFDFSPSKNRFPPMWILQLELAKNIMIPEENVVRLVSGHWICTTFCPRILKMYSCLPIKNLAWLDDPNAFLSKQGEVAFWDLRKMSAHWIVGDSVCFVPDTTPSKSGTVWSKLRKTEICSFGWTNIGFRSYSANANSGITTYASKKIPTWIPLYKPWS